MGIRLGDGNMSLCATNILCGIMQTRTKLSPKILILIKRGSMITFNITLLDPKTIGTVLASVKNKPFIF